MSDIVTLYVPPLTDCSKTSESKGKRLYNKNNNYRNIVNVMEHPEFREFFDTHFSTWEDTKLMLMFMKLYKDIEQTSPVELNGYQKLSIIDTIMKDRDLRRQLCEQTTKYYRNTLE